MFDASTPASQVHNVKKYTFAQSLWGLANLFPFLESLEHEESENQCLHVHRFLQGQNFLISK